MSEQQSLKRVIGLPLITLYGIGTIVGAGIYVLISKVAATSGYHAPISFLVSAIVVAFTALSYAELSSRFPRSAGEAFYVSEAFSLSWLSQFVGLAVVATGIVSAATITRGFVGYFSLFVAMDGWLIMLMLVTGIALLAIWGVAESLRAAAIITCIEVAGIFIVLASTQQHWTTPPSDWALYIPEFNLSTWTPIGLGAFLAFFAFIGFEDMVNMAEEVKEVRSTLPKAIILALVVTTILYMLVAWAAVRALPMDKLMQSEAPFADLVADSQWMPVWGITLISLLAISNGALIQVIMGARVLYGMACQRLMPHWLSRINRQTRTPVNATAVVAMIVLLFAWLLPLEQLAKVTSFIIICVFAMVNLSLLRIKIRDRKSTSDDDTVVIRYPFVVPLLGLLLTCALLSVQLLGE